MQRKTAYDPFSRAPTGAPRVRVRVGRGDFVRATTCINLPDPKTPSRRRVMRGKRIIVRIRVK